MNFFEIMKFFMQVLYNMQVGDAKPVHINSTGHMYSLATGSFTSSCFTSAFTSADINFYNFPELDSKLSKKKKLALNFPFNRFIQPAPLPHHQTAKIYCQVGWHWTISNVFSKQNWLPWSHGSNITNLNYYSLSFPDAKMTASLHMHFCQTNTTKVAQSCPIKLGDFEQREILWLEKLIQISPARTAICDMHKSNNGFCTSLDT